MYRLSLHERNQLLLKKYEDEFNSNYRTDYSSEPIKTSKMMSVILESILPDYLQEKPNRQNDMDLLFESFKQKHFPELKKDVLEKVNMNDNLYNMFNAKALSGANSFTRTLSTKLGLFWEVIANLSSNVVSPEVEFAIKLKGVDAIIYQEEKFYYAQMKTQRNTLTGSQSGRTTSELSVYQNSLFVSCIDNHSSWTYSGSISRKAGKSFWSMCNLNYSRILQNTEKLINEAEDFFLEITNL